MLADNHFLSYANEKRSGVSMLEVTLVSSALWLSKLQQGYYQIESDEADMDTALGQNI